MWIKANGETPEVWPYDMTKLKADNPNTAFPRNPTAETLAAFNTYIGTVGAVPEYDYLTQQTSLDVPVYENGEWSVEFLVTDRPQDEAEDAIRGRRNGLLAATDNWALSDRTMTQAQTDYRQALRDVPNQEGFPYSVVWPTDPS